LGRSPLPFAEKPQQKVLRSYEFMTETLRLILSQSKGLARSLRKSL
jgi:hypothetical protein